MKKELSEIFGGIDIYLFDKIIRGRFDCVKKVLDVGCGSGINLKYLAEYGVDVYGIDKSETTIDRIRAIYENIPTCNFRVATADNLPYETDHFDAVICNAVLHFADNDNHFDKMIKEIWRVIAPGGV